jgi:TPR repeat protein
MVRVSVFVCSCSQLLHCSCKMFVQFPLGFFGRRAIPMFLLAEMNFYGNFSHPRDFKEAFRWYHELAWLDGISERMFPASAANSWYIRAFAWSGSTAPPIPVAYNIRSEMTLAYRYHTGIGTPKDCDHAIHYYKKVADRVAFVGSRAF